MISMEQAIQLFKDGDFCPYCKYEGKCANMCSLTLTTKTAPRIDTVIEDTIISIIKDDSIDRQLLCINSSGFNTLPFTREAITVICKEIADIQEQKHVGFSEIRDLFFADIDKAIFKPRIDIETILEYINGCRDYASTIEIV